MWVCIIHLVSVKKVTTLWYETVVFSDFWTEGKTQGFLVKKCYNFFILLYYNIYTTSIVIADFEEL